MKIAKLYKNKYEKDKYFIFLDLVQPADFNCEEGRYLGYKFVSYENILNILKKILKKKPFSIVYATQKARLQERELFALNSCHVPYHKPFSDNL